MSKPITIHTPPAPSVPRTEAPLELPTTLVIDRISDGHFTATFAGRTVTGDSLWTLMEGIYREFEDEDDNLAAEKALAEAKTEGTIPWEQVKSELEI